jgi:hypothetical protein
MVGLHKWNVDDLERQLSGRIVSQLVVTAEVDHGPHAVVCDGLPAGIRQLPNTVRSDDSAIAGLGAVLRRKPTEVADVEAALPGQLSRTKCQFRR